MTAHTDGNIFWPELKGRAKCQLQNLYTAQPVVITRQENYGEASEQQHLSEVLAEKHLVELHHLLKSIAPSTH
jgi:hypothetical protein